VHTLFKLTGAALLAASATVASAQQTPPGTTAPTEPQGVKEAPLPSKQPPAPDEKGVGSRAMGGPSQDFSTSNKEMERKGTTPKTLEEQGKSGNKN
jgi:hypothetical protein